ncbi:TetR/AcrR family transcriptional regulator [Acetobacterium woodii]|nr:TetR/AcrR family transcriptional regulator [Acetobacterium woodii]
MATITTKRESKKEVILENAKQLFSEKGYDGTSMDQIALQTGVPKSLIYYHFKSKETLLNAIVFKFFDEYDQLLRVGDVDCQERLNNYLDYLEKNSDFLRIILVESLKKGNKSVPVFKVLEPLMTYQGEIAGAPELADDKKSQFRWIAEFFTSIMPSVLFACYQEQWCNYFDVDKKQVKENFIAAYNQTHGEYHQKQLKGAVKNDKNNNFDL